MRGDAGEPDLPEEARWAPGAAEPHVLAVLRWEAAAGDPAPVAHARVRLGRLLTRAAPLRRRPLRLRAAGLDADRAPASWRPFALGATGAPPEERVLVTAVQEDELRAFCSLVTRRTPRSGPLAWALARFTTACEAPGPPSRRSPTCCSRCARCSSPRARPRAGCRAGWPRCAPRPPAAASWPSGSRAGSPPSAGRSRASRPTRALAALVAELAGHLRALLRDVLCGHLDADLRAVADRLLDDEAQEQPTLA